MGLVPKGERFEMRRVSSACVLPSGEPTSAMTSPEEAPAQAAAADAAGKYLGIDADPASRRRAAIQFFLGAVQSAVFIPLLFKLRFGEVGPLGWGTTVFFAAYCLLAAVALFFRQLPQYHTKVAMRGDWTDKVGAFWLVACTFGPLFGWIATSVLPVTAGSWHWVYGLRAFLAAGLPLITAIPLTRYVRGKAAWVSLPILIIITLLPVSTAVRVTQDLRDGPRQGVLVHTGRSVGNTSGAAR